MANTLMDLDALLEATLERWGGEIEYSGLTSVNGWFFIKGTRKWLC